MVALRAAGSGGITAVWEGEPPAVETIKHMVKHTELHKSGGKYKGYVVRELFISL